MRIANPIRGTLKRKKAFESHKELKVVKPKKEKFPAKKKLTQEEILARIGARDIKFEMKIAQQIIEVEGEVQYETMKIKFIQPPKNRSYKPDFILKNGIIIETKGKFTLGDRQKHLFIKEQYPDLDIRFVFTNAGAKLRKGAKSRYCDWCEKEGFQYANKEIPKEWFLEVKDE